MSITLRNITIGESIPKIAVPIIGKTEEEILKQAKQIAESCADIAEWRVDYFEMIADLQAVSELIAKLKSILGETLLLYTCRTKQEGGEAECSPEAYRQIVFAGIGKQGADLIDGELSAGEEFIAEAADAVRGFGGALIASYHNFSETPEKDLLAEKFRRMNACGADVFKIAVMPKNRDDVERLMAVTRMIAEETGKPLVGISMGELGRETRYMGERFGSCITFGTVDGASAPGQIASNELKQLLEEVHDKL